MIASLRGRLRSREPVPVVEIGGLGLAVHVSARTAAQLPDVGDEVTLLTYLYVREDQLALYGFYSVEERALFLNLLSVSGIGPRVALTLLSSAPLDEFERAIEEKNETYLRRLPGLGPKTAARLIVELQGKLSAKPVGTAARLDSQPLFEEAILALSSLGLTPRGAREAVQRVDVERLGPEPRVEDIVKAALQSAARK